MKKHISIIFFWGVLSLASKAQFKVSNEINCPAEYVNDAQALINLKDAAGFNFFPELFKNIDDLKTPPEFKNVECLFIQFSFSPESSDSAKAEFIKKLKTNITAFNFLFKSPKLKRIHFSVGEQIFLTSAETKNYYDIPLKQQEKLIKKNLENAWNAFGKDIQALNPKIELSAENWGW
jgi:hypothetical protein